MRMALTSRRLWHQLTLKIEQIIEQPQWKPELTTLYGGFIEHFETKLNQLALVKIAVTLSKHHSRTFSEPRMLCASLRA